MKRSPYPFRGKKYAAEDDDARTARRIAFVSRHPNATEELRTRLSHLFLGHRNYAGVRQHLEAIGETDPAVRRFLRDTDAMLTESKTDDMRRDTSRTLAEVDEFLQASRQGNFAAMQEIVRRRAERHAK